MSYPPNRLSTFKSSPSTIKHQSNSVTERRPYPYLPSPYGHATQSATTTFNLRNDSSASKSTVELQSNSVTERRLRPYPPSPYAHATRSIITTSNLPNDSSASESTIELQSNSVTERKPRPYPPSPYAHATRSATIISSPPIRLSTSQLPVDFKSTSVAEIRLCPYPPSPYTRVTRLVSTLPSPPGPPVAPSLNTSRAREQTRPGANGQSSVSSPRRTDEHATPNPFSSQTGIVAERDLPPIPTSSSSSSERSSMYSPSPSHVARLATTLPNSSDLSSTSQSTMGLNSSSVYERQSRPYPPSFFPRATQSSTTISNPNRLSPSRSTTALASSSGSERLRPYPPSSRHHSTLSATTVTNPVNHLPTLQSTEVRSSSSPSPPVAPSLGISFSQSRPEQMLSALNGQGSRQTVTNRSSALNSSPSQIETVAERNLPPIPPLSPPTSLMAQPSGGSPARQTSVSNPSANTPDAQLTDEQLDFVSRLSSANVPATDIAQLIERMKADRAASIQGLGRSTSRDPDTAPPSYDALYSEDV